MSAEQRLKARRILGDIWVLSLRIVTREWRAEDDTALTGLALSWKDCRHGDLS